MLRSVSQGVLSCLTASLAGALLVTACSSEGTDGGDGGGTSSGGTGATSGGSGGTSAGSAGSAGAPAGSGGTSAVGGTGTGGTGGTAGQSGATSSGGAGGGSAGTSGGVGGGAGTSGGAAGAGAGGIAGASGETSGGAAGAGSGGASGSGGSGGSGGWTCPSGITGMPTLGTPTRVTSVPPPDDFNMNNGTWGNIEGPLWIDDALYLSEMSVTPYEQANSEVKRSRMLKVTADGQASVVVADSGSNGLAVDATGNILAAVHKDGSITRFSLPGFTPTPVVPTYMNARFNSPNDLAIRSDGTFYFSDPFFNAPNTRPQAQTRVYRVPPNGEPEPIPSAANPDMFNNPNGVALSLAEDYLYVAASVGRRYPVMTDGSLGPGEDFAATTGADGLAVDCAGNLYVVMSNQNYVTAYTPAGSMIGRITVNDVQALTNAAFGGADHQTLYLTGMGNNKGLFQLAMNLPGRPY